MSGVADDRPSGVDERMARLLADGATAEARSRLREESSAESEDLLARIQALDFVSSVVGEAGDLPERLGDYRITGLLGRGGMGTVYLAWQEQLEREVALKVLSPQLSADPTMRQRFRVEARSTAALHHAHIVPIYDYGESNGALYFAMERVDGVSLDRVISNARKRKVRPMEPLVVARSFAGVADALGLAHRRRLLHRDVKPGNILMAADGTLALTDFGLAKVLDRASVQLTTSDGGFLGTLHYASPEQATGRLLTPASDLYSLGVTLFEAVTGELPLPGNTPEALLQNILHGTPRRLRDVMPHAPRDLETVIDKLLQREPQDRYQDGEALARDLQRVAEGEPILIRRAPLLQRAWRRMRRNPLLYGALSLAAALLLATIVLFGVLRRERGQADELRHQERLAVLATDIKAEAGPPAGPEGLFTCLTGLVPPSAPPSAGLVARIDAAAEEDEADPLPARMREAYLTDPLPAATALLAEGRGHEARAVLDAALAQAVGGRSGGDLALDLRLYRLYVCRAVASLTAVAARAEDARMDLALASFLRPGATFPRDLVAVLDVLQGPSPAAGWDALRASLGDGSARIGTCAALVAAAAGLPGVGPGHALTVVLPPAEQLALAAALADAVPADWARAGLQPAGARLDAMLRAAIERTGSPAEFAARRSEVEQYLDGWVHPASPLQAARAVLQLMAAPTAETTLFDAQGRELDVALQLAGYDRLVELGAPSALLRLVLPRFEALRRGLPPSLDVVRVAARLHGAVDSPAAADLAQRWVELSPLDPEALFCRMRVRLMQGMVFEPASDDGTAALQRSLEPLALLDRIVAACATAAEARPVRRVEFERLAAAFRELAPELRQANERVR